MWRRLPCTARLRVLACGKSVRGIRHPQPRGNPPRALERLFDFERLEHDGVVLGLEGGEERRDGCLVSGAGGHGGRFLMQTLAWNQGGGGHLLALTSIRSSLVRGSPETGSVPFSSAGGERGGGEGGEGRGSG